MKIEQFIHNTHNPMIRAAKRLHELDFYESMDQYDGDILKVAAEIVKNPADCINYLLDIIEDMQRA